MGIRDEDSEFVSRNQVSVAVAMAIIVAERQCKWFVALQCGCNVV